MKENVVYLGLIAFHTFHNFYTNVPYGIYQAHIFSHCVQNLKDFAYTEKLIRRISGHFLICTVIFLLYLLISKKYRLNFQTVTGRKGYL